MITLKGKPVSTQTIYKYACRGNFPTMYMTKKGKNKKKSYIKQAKEQFDGEITEKQIEMDIKIYFNTHHRRDIDNYNKLVLDALEGIIYKDDKQIKKLVLEKFYDKENPRIEVSWGIKA